MKAFSLTRCWAVLVKEIIQFKRDRMTFLILLSVPVVELLLFGFAINFDARKLPTAVVDMSRDRFSRNILGSLEMSGFFRLDHNALDAETAERLLKSGDVQFIVTIPSDLGTRALRGEDPQILVEADMTDPTAASGAIAALEQISASALASELPAPGGTASAAVPLNIVVHKRFNPESISQYNIIPGLLGVILEMSMMITTGLALTRESERGTIENLISLPFTSAEVLIGKILPYIAVGIVQAVSVILVAQHVFHVPILGALPLLAVACLTFIVCTVLLGYTFSTFVKTQMQATQVIMFYFLPSLLLSGFMFPFRGMPRWAQGIGELLPLTHFMRIARGVMLKGANFQEIARPYSALLIFIVAFSAVALIRFRRTLD